MSRHRCKHEPLRSREPTGHLVKAALLFWEGRGVGGGGCSASDLICKQATSPLRYACEHLGMCEQVFMRVRRNSQKRQRQYRIRHRRVLLRANLDPAAYVRWSPDDEEAEEDFWTQRFLGFPVELQLLSLLAPWFTWINTTATVSASV